MREFYHDGILKEPDPNRRALTENAEMRVNWDLVFKNVPGDEVYLLVSKPGFSQSLSSDNPSGKKWLVTKVLKLMQSQFRMP